MGFGFDIAFTIFPILFGLMFLLVFGLILTSIIRSMKQWNHNNHSPRLTVNARVVSKRSHISHHHHNGVHDPGHHYHSSTSYFVTFQVDSGDRMELSVAGHEYGLLIEGDQGMLTFQGTRYLGFIRT